MKKLLIFCLILIINIAALASTAFDITVGYNNKKSELEVRFTSVLKTGTKAVFTIIDEKGIIQFTKTSKLVKGENNIGLEEIAKLKEGNYSVSMKVDNKISTSKFTIWK